MCRRRTRVVRVVNRVFVLYNWATLENVVVTAISFIAFYPYLDLCA